MNINMPTSLAGGRYQLGQLVGRGGMAEVHVATDTRLGRTVAVKIMRADFATDSIFLERFRREAHSVAQMNNPNIVNIYDSGEETIVNESGQTERVPYLVMEFFAICIGAMRGFFSLHLMKLAFLMMVFHLMLYHRHNSINH